jgi:hypothetical protein
MGAGERDVAADGPADDGDDREQVDPLRDDRSDEGLTQRWRGGERYDEGQCDQHEAEREAESVHGAPGFLHHEEGDRQDRTQRGADGDRDPTDDLQPQACSSDVPHVEGESPQDHEEGEEGAESRDHPIGDRSRALPRRRDHPPDGELRDEIDDDAREDREAEACPETLGEDRGLREEPRPDGRGRHQEGGADQRRTWSIRHPRVQTPSAEARERRKGVGWAANVAMP